MKEDLLYWKRGRWVLVEFLYIYNYGGIGGGI